MVVVNATKARQNLYSLIKEVNENSEPITIVNNKGSNAVLISEDDWKDIEETLFLNSIPGLANRILEGKETPVEDCLDYDENEEW